MKLIKFLKDWTLIISMLAGIAAYFIYVSLPLDESIHTLARRSVAIVQPLLIFAMLFLTFCKVDIRDLRPARWHFLLLLFQAGLFSGLALLLISMPDSGMRVVLEGAMICLICPTATAGAVITRRLGGDVAGITTYTIIINIATAVLIPALVPLVHPQPDMSPLRAGLLILGKVFPLLLMPLLSAMFVRRFLPALCRRLEAASDLAFYLWAIALALALTVTTRSIVHSDVDIATELGLVAVSLLCCLLQFAVGRKLGAPFGEKITAGQSLGQKNTVLAIWMGYTFFSPITSIVGGFYSIWHNVINSWQLYLHKQAEERQFTSAPGVQKAPDSGRR